MKETFGNSGGEGDLFFFTKMEIPEYKVFAHMCR